jgi:hypothetical protein
MEKAPEPDARERKKQATELLRGGRLDEALEEYDWLWRNMHHLEPELSGVRVSFMAQEIGKLCEGSAAARARFGAIRDETEKAALSSTETAAREWRFDWIVLNEALGEGERTLAWFDAEDKVAAREIIDRCAHRLIPLLRERGRWADVGRLFLDPVAEIRSEHATAESALLRFPPDQEHMRQELAKVVLHSFRDHAGVLCRGLRAAERPEDAAAVEHEALRLDDTPEMREALTRAPG